MIKLPMRRSAKTSNESGSGAIPLFVIGLALLACLWGTLPAAAQQVTAPVELKNLKYRSIGPSAGGRVCRVSGVPGDPQVYYAATASGGIWKSSDGGINWKPIFDDQPVSSVGCIAVSASNPNIIYAGT